MNKKQKRKLLSTLSWKKNIRIRMFWAAFLSFSCMVALSYILTYLSLDLMFFGVIGDLIFMIVSFLFFFFLFTRPIVRYLRTLAEGLLTIAGGNLDYRLPASNEDELGEVAKSINFMAEQLQEKINRERQIENSKMELITSVSHDLRTPLTSIIGYLNLLKNDNLEDLDEHKRYINNAYNKSQQLKKLIDDLFEYTRLTSGAANLSFTKVDVNSLLEQIMNEFEPIALEKSLTVRTFLDQKPIYGYVDTEKMVRAIDNLLMNALKFSVKPGEITVRLSADEQHIYFAVENRGKPIPEEQEKLLFERFYKADPSRNDHHGSPGAGMGLSIAKNIVELHGGRIGLNHQNGHFTFFIII
ncbi:HAMP domain-containing histidine kinase [Brevibacillus ruminantium]|uniref:histidine kinase n=1 Tax=Brevibacillus ruminantium TaxID=2950604 RepID=A0ABY4WPT4_9BACL|nr:HAMP domain-containing sensor histidine kinase [Brevibacillus ruminantium]USG67885.1 HAMP domain-containing histidine kinase [Brevibacillus ruminantium]